jgi:hypothetical protein
MNDRIFIHTVYDDKGDVESLDWSPLRLDPTDVEYLLAFPVLNTIDRLMTTSWNFKTLHLALHPDHKIKSWVIQLESAMKFADKLFPSDEKRQWRK